MEEVKRLLEEQGRSFEEFKARQDAKFESIKKDVDTLTMRANRPPAGKSEGQVTEHKEGPHMEFFDEKGVAIPALQHKQRISDLPQYKDSADPDQRMSLGRAVKGMVIGDWTGAAAERKAMAEGVGGLGGFMVPSGVSASVLDMARVKAVCSQAGAITLPMDGPELTIVKVSSDPTAYWRKENAEITESAAGFVPVKLKALALACLVRVSVELIEDAAQFASVLENAISQALGLELDRAGLMGTGVGEPRGIYYTEGVNERSLGTNGGNIRHRDFSYASQMIYAANGTPNAVVYSPRTWGNLDRLIDTTNNPRAIPESYAALGKYVTTAIPENMTKGTASTASCAIEGDYSQLLFGMRTQIVLEASRVGSTTFTNMQALIRAYLRADVAVLRPDHFTKITGILDETVTES